MEPSKEMQVAGYKSAFSIMFCTANSFISSALSHLGKKGWQSHIFMPVLDGAVLKFAPWLVGDVQYDIFNYRHWLNFNSWNLSDSNNEIQKQTIRGLFISRAQKLIF